MLEYTGERCDQDMVWYETVQQYCREDELAGLWHLCGRRQMHAGFWWGN